MSEEDIPVSAAMMEAGCTEWPYSDVEHFGSYDDVCAIYRAMERARRAEAADDVIRRSVRDGLICEHGKHVLRDPPCKDCVSEIDKFRRRGAD